MFGTLRRQAFTYGTPLRISKPCNGESGFEYSVLKGNNLIQLSLIYLTGSIFFQLQFQIYNTTSIKYKCYITDLKRSYTKYRNLA
jgi:hypothetical protein